MGTSHRAILIILDGFGIGKESPCNAIANAKMPFYRNLLMTCPHSELLTHGSAVGLPDGVMGNSEVGHMAMGSGRVQYQDLVRISRSINDGSFEKNPVLVTAMRSAGSSGSCLHLMGLLSDGGVHSHIEHLEALLSMALKEGIRKIAVHAFLDGRDTPPDSGRGYLERILKHPAIKQGIAKVATLTGRYFAMDRDQRWERTEKAFQTLTGKVEALPHPDPLQALETSYALESRGDEFVEPVLLDSTRSIQSGDSVIFFNFRADRARQISRKFFESTDPKLSTFTGMTEYDATFPIPAAFRPLPLTHLFGEILEKNGLKQFRVAETEKYAHVTFFFNGGREEPYRGEDRTLIPSPRDVATYDLKPQMSAKEVAAEAVRRIESGAYDFILMNFANSDMVGHTGNYAAAVKAMETLDACLKDVISAGSQNGYHTLLTADHGNAEEMCDSEGHPHTQHTLNPVPCLWVAPGSISRGGKEKMKDGTLSDLYPTLCDLMGIPSPAEVTGSSLLSGKGMKR